MNSAKPRLPLLADAAENGRYPDSPTVVTRDNETNWMDEKWAHYDGGNMIMHDGSAKWYFNAPWTSSQYTDWPSEYGAYFNFIDTLVE